PSLLLAGPSPAGRTWIELGGFEKAVQPCLLISPALSGAYSYGIRIGGTGRTFLGAREPVVKGRPSPPGPGSLSSTSTGSPRSPARPTKPPASRRQGCAARPGRPGRRVSAAATTRAAAGAAVPCRPEPGGWSRWRRGEPRPGPRRAGT